MKLFTLVFLSLAFTVFAQNEFEEITFLSEDSLKITADLYMPHPADAPFILLFHQANWSRGEYRETAPVLNRMGYNCMAVDQRSGGEVNEVVNQTHKRASANGLAVSYLDAYPDMKAALKYLDVLGVEGPVILFGSSYSASLVFVLAAEYKDRADGIIAFSPGEYFTKAGMPEDYIAAHASQISAPVFITSAKEEQKYWRGIYEQLRMEQRTYFLPETEGNHGSRALWQEFDDSQSYWAALIEFLNAEFPGN